LDLQSTSQKIDSCQLHHQVQPWASCSTHVHLSVSCIGTSQWAVMLGGSEGNACFADSNDSQSAGLWLQSPAQRQGSALDPYIQYQYGSNFTSTFWPHLFRGAGHEKTRGEQLKWLKWSLAFSLYIGSFSCAQLPGPVYAARLGPVFFVCLA